MQGVPSSWARPIRRLSFPLPSLCSYGLFFLLTSTLNIGRGRAQLSQAPNSLPGATVPIVWSCVHPCLEQLSPSKAQGVGGSSQRTQAVVLDSQVSSSATDPAEPVFSSFSPFLPFRPADEPSREPNPSVELTCTSLVPKGSRDPGANSHMAKPSGQDAPPAVAVTNFLYGVSLPTQIAMDLKQEVSSGLHGATMASEVLLPRPSGELKVPSSQEYSDCCGNSLEFARRRGPGAKPHGAERETFGAGRMGPAGWGWKVDAVIGPGAVQPSQR